MTGLETNPRHDRRERKKMVVIKKNCFRSSRQLKSLTKL